MIPTEKQAIDYIRTIVPELFFKVNWSRQIDIGKLEEALEIEVCSDINICTNEIVNEPTIWGIWFDQNGNVTGER